MLLTADQHRRLAEVYEEAAADQSHSPEDRKLLSEGQHAFGFLSALPRRRRRLLFELNLRVGTTLALRRLRAYHLQRISPREMIGPTSTIAPASYLWTG